MCDHGLSFPEFWPDDCPPPDATPIESPMVVYRMVANEPPEASDFLDHVELGRNKNACECLRRALSVFDSLDGARQNQRKYKRLFRGQRPFKGTLLPGCGVYRGRGHLSWWPSDGIQKEDLFR